MTWQNCRYVFSLITTVVLSVSLSGFAFVGCIPYRLEVPFLYHFVEKRDALGRKMRYKMGGVAVLNQILIDWRDQFSQEIFNVRIEIDIFARFPFQSYVINCRPGTMLSIENPLFCQVLYFLLHWRNGCPGIAPAKIEIFSDKQGQV